MEDKVLHLSKRSSKEYYCELTNEMNQYLKHADKVLEGRKFFGTYLFDYGDRKEFDDQEGYIYSIRVPGATRGGVFLDTNNIIVEIRLDKEQCSCFKETVYDAVQKYVGYKIERE